MRAGDDTAFECLYGRYHRRIAAYIYGMVNDHGRAEDITQDVFMSALRRMRETERPIHFKPWVYEIAKNACIDAFRRSRRAEEVSYDAEDGLGSADYGKLVSTSPTPDVAVDTRMSLDHLRGAFGGLSETHHDILVMRELEGLSYREIGERLGMSRPSVESTLFRARRRLTEEYEELVSGERCQSIQTLIAGSTGRKLGAREQRRMGRHVSYCQPCRRHAFMAGFDLETLTAAPKTLREKVAALLPLPAFLKRRWTDDAGSGAPGAGATSLANASSAVAGYAEPASSAWVKAAAVAVLAAGAVGAGVATSGAGFGGKDERPAAVRNVQDASAGGAGAAATGAAVPVTSRSTRSGSGERTGAKGSGSGSGDRSAAVSVEPGGSGSGSASGSGGDAGMGASGAGTASTGGDATSSPTTAVGDTVKKTTDTATGNDAVPAPLNVDVPSVSVPLPSTTTTSTPDVTGTVTDTVTDTTSGVTDTVDSTVSGTTDTVNDTVGGVTDTAGGAVGGLPGGG